MEECKGNYRVLIFSSHAALSVITSRQCGFFILECMYCFIMELKQIVLRMFEMYKK